MFHRGIGVGVLPVAALDTSERGLVGTVGARGMTTSETQEVQRVPQGARAHGQGKLLGNHDQEHGNRTERSQIAFFLRVILKKLVDRPFDGIHHFAGSSAARIIVQARWASAIETFDPEAHCHTSGFKQPGSLRHAMMLDGQHYYMCSLANPADFPPSHLLEFF